MGSRWLTVALVATLLLAACNGGDGDAPAQPTSTAAPSATAQRTPTAEEVTLPLRPDQPALYVVNTDGSGLRKLFAEGDSIDYALSPDETWVAITGRGRFEDGVLVILNLETGERHEVLRQSYLRVAPAQWSPDGKWLALHGVPAGDSPYYVHLYSLEGKGLVRYPEAFARFVGWSPGSDAVFVSRYAEDEVVFERVDITSLRGEETVPAMMHHPTAPLSPDGQWLPTVESVDEGDVSRRKVSLVRPDGSERRDLTTVEVDEGVGISVLAWSPDGRRLLYTLTVLLESSAAVGLYVVDVASGATTRVTQPADANDISAAWSPDGERLLVTRRHCLACYTDNRSSWREVLLVAANGSGESVLLRTSDQIREVLAAWSPDGSQLVYSDDALYVADVDGADPQPLVELDASGYYSPVWSPISDRIFFVRRATEEPITYAVRPDGTDLEVLGVGSFPTAPAGKAMVEVGYDEVQRQSTLTIVWPGQEPQSFNAEGIGSFRWLLDGSALAFTLREGIWPTLFVSEADGGLRELGAFFSNSRFSPDGTRIAQPSNGYIRVVDVAAPTTSVTLEGEFSQYDQMVWSPDGSEIAVLSDGVVRAIGADAKSAARSLFSVGIERTTSVALWWSPDGAHIAVAVTLAVVDERPLVVGSVETGEVWQVDEGVVGGLAWMPDGERLVFSKDPPFAGDIYVVDVDGGNLIQLTETTGRPHRVLGVLDDGRIMFSSSR